MILKIYSLTSTSWCDEYTAGDGDVQHFDQVTFDPEAGETAGVSLRGWHGRRESLQKVLSGTSNVQHFSKVHTVTVAEDQYIVTADNT